MVSQCDSANIMVSQCDSATIIVSQCVILLP